MTTSRSLRLLGGLLALLLLLPGAARAQQQTGSLLFEVTDPAGAAIAGAKITISSDKVPQGREGLTDEHGKARFLLLPVGPAYKAVVAAEGFNTHTEETIEVGLGQRVNVAVKLQPIMEESVEVVAPGEVTIADIDVSETKTSTVITAKQLEAVQLGSGGRSYLAALAKTPGVVGGSGNPSVHGATIGENSYTIDGVNTTDPVTGTFGLLTNFDIIEQLEVSTGGFQAEYGGATGGIVNQVTKSGTNEFNGSLDLRKYNEKFIENSPHFTDSLPVSFEKYSFTLTGPVVKDKLWFALSYEDNATETSPAGSATTRVFEGSANLLKLTWEPAAGHRVSFQYTEDPAEISNANAGRFVDPTATRFQAQGANFYKVNYSGQLTDNWALTVQGGLYESALDSYPMVDSGLPAVTDAYTGYSFQNYGNAQYSVRSNDQWSFQLQRSWSASKGDHDLKFGVDSQKTGLEFNSYTPANETWSSLGNPDDPTTPEREESYLAPDANGDTIPDNVYERVISIPAGPTSNPGQNWSAYVQDTWRRGRFTYDFGIRWDKATADRDDGKSVVDVQLVQPRLGMSMDIKGDGRQKFSWSLSRRMHPGILTIPNAVNTHAAYSDYYYNEQLARDLGFFDEDTDPTNPCVPGTEADLDCDGVVEDAFSFENRYGGPSGSTVDPGLKATYLDEVVIGYERKLKTSMRWASRLILNETNDIIEDTEFPRGSGQYEIRNLPELRREYKGIELEYGWRHRRGDFSAIATISQTKGNVEYTQGLGTDFDVYPVHFTNRYGYLSTDALLRIRVFGYVDVPKNWQIGYELNYRSGAAYNRTRAAAPYGVEFLEARGSRRIPAFYTLDSEIRKNFFLGKNDRFKLTALGNITNIFNANAVTAVQTNDPVRNSRFGQATAWQGPRQLELGIRLTF